MSDITVFFDFWQKKSGAPESKIVKEYMEAKSNLESKQTDLLKLIIPRRTAKGLVPVFKEGAEDRLSEFEIAESHLSEIKGDIETYLALADGQPSMILLNDRLMRAKHAIADAVMETKQAIIHAVQETKVHSQIEVLDYPEVQSAMDDRDRIQGQLEPVIEDLQNRIAKIKDIQNKYARIEI